MSENYGNYLLLLIILFVLFGVFVNSRTSSNNKNPFEGKVLKRRSARINGQEYGFIVEVGVNDTHLMFRTTFPPKFRIDILYENLEMKPVKSLIWKYIQLLDKSNPKIDILISNSLAKKISQLSIGKFSIEGT